MTNPNFYNLNTLDRWNCLSYFFASIRSLNQMFLCITLSAAGGISRKYFGNEV